MAVINTLRERIQSYESISDYKLISKLPLIIIINGRSFKKTTSLLTKPFSSDFIEIIGAVMIKLAQEIDGSTFLYSFNDEIVVVSRNDQNIDTNPWYDNRIQKIVSASASIATCEFNKIAKIKELPSVGDSIFTSHAFVVPNVTEAINVLIAKQQQAFHAALHLACFYELIKKYEPDIVKQTLNEKTPQAKAEILFEECNIDFNNYPLPFRRGAACYRVPRVIATETGEEIKNKLTIDTELPLFTKDHDFLSNIFRTGRDIFRAKRDV